MKRKVSFFVVLFWCKFIFSSAANLAVFIAEKNQKEIEKLIDSQSVNLSYQDANGNSLLMISIDNKWTKIIDDLISKKINLDTKNRFGETALSLAVLDGNVEVVKKLIDAGIDTQAQNNVGRKAVNLATILLRNELISLDSNKKQKYEEIHSLLKESSCSCVIA